MSSMMQYKPPLHHKRPWADSTGADNERCGEQSLQQGSRGYRRGGRAGSEGHEEPTRRRGRRHRAAVQVSISHAPAGATHDDGSSLCCTQPDEGAGVWAGALLEVAGLELDAAGGGALDDALAVVRGGASGANGAKASGDCACGCASGTVGGGDIQLKLASSPAAALDASLSETVVIA